MMASFKTVILALFLAGDYNPGPIYDPVSAGLRMQTNHCP
jgi:hypothetical protein